MTELRWVIKRNHVTAEQIREYILQHSCSMRAAKTVLEDADMPTLQYRTSLTGRWEDVPVYVEYRDPPVVLGSEQ